MRDGMLRYRRELRKALCCTRKTKNSLLAQFLVYQQKVIDELSSPTYEQMVILFGPPEEMAEVLMVEVTPEENDHYQKRRRLYLGVAGGLLAVLIVFTAYTTFIKELTTIVITVEEKTEIIAQSWTP